MAQLWIGIETSCDETACAIVDSNLRVLSNPLYSQLNEHQTFGGVVPEIAARAHLEKIAPIARAALREAGIEAAELSAIAYTCGPGLMGPLLVGASFARGLAADLGIPAYGINHLEGHLAAAHLSDPHLQPPYLSLTVSGGHTELVLVEPGFRHTLIGRTRDDAAGEAFDKCGKLLGLGYPAGSAISRLAQNGDPHFVRFPMGLVREKNADFSFSGLKTAVLRYTQEHSTEFIRQNLSSIAASLEEAITEILSQKTAFALRQTKASTLVLGGGVSANARLRRKLETLCRKMGVSFHPPELQYCTDNGAMIAAAAILRSRQGALQVETAVRPWYPLAEGA